MSENDFYGLLELTPDATEKDITRAYRKKALKFHPDKNKSKEAVKIFHELSKAYEVLLDPKARSAYDAVVKAKKAKELRDQQLSAGRRKLKDELEAREQAAKRQKTEKAAGYQEPASEDFSVKELEKEIERLRKHGFQKVQAEQEKMREELAKQHSGSDQQRRSAAPSPLAPIDTALSRTLKIKWKKGDGDIYTQDAIKTLLEKYGPINHVIVSAKKAGSAVVEFVDLESARRAVAMETLFKLSWADPNAVGHSQGSAAAAKEAPASPSTHTSASAADDFEARVLANMRKTQEIRRQLADGSKSELPENLRDYESPVARELRLKEERQRLIAQMMAEENE